jgi:hypothetical protein
VWIPFDCSFNWMRPQSRFKIKKCKPFWQEYCRIMLCDVGYYEGTLD